MSELTPCNYCTLQSIKKRAREQGLKVTIMGQDIYKHPKTIFILDLTEEERKKYFVAWLMEIPEYCCC